MGEKKKAEGSLAMEGLKPCPFCGGEPEVIHHDIDNEGTWCRWEIRCSHGLPYNDIYGERGDTWCMDLFYAGDNLETIIEQWNKRR